MSGEVSKSYDTLDIAKPAVSTDMKAVNRAAFDVPPLFRKA